MSQFENRNQRAAGRVWIIGLLLGLTLTNLRPAHAGQAALVPGDSWLGTYVNNKKAGYTGVHIKKTIYNGKPALDTVSTSVVRMEMFGTTVEQNVVQHTVSDLKGQPLTEVFDLSSNGSNVHLDARFNYAAHKIVCKVGNAPNITTKTIVIPRGANLAGDTTLGITEQPVVGKKYTYYALEPLSVDLKPTQVEVVRKENVVDTMTGKEVSAFVVKIETAGGAMTAWMQDADTMVKAELALGPVVMLMRNEPKELAMNLKSPDLPATATANGGTKYVPPADFAVATAVVSDKIIPDPRRLRSLQVNITGIPDKKLVLSDARQNVTDIQPSEDGKSYSAHFDINAQPFEKDKSAQWPVTDAEWKPYLAKGQYLETDNAQIKATALKLRGQETSLYTIASNIRDWVSQHMTPDASIGVPRAAADIYKRPRGVCRDYATLYAAIARAAGVPTRLCTGIVYAEGHFFYHAWAESYVGEWVTFDPTLYDTRHPVSYVDATHIKFAQGDVLQMFEVVAIVGKIHLTVQNFAL